jgi:hypothetical protein
LQSYYLPGVASERGYIYVDTNATAAWDHWGSNMDFGYWSFSMNDSIDNLFYIYVGESQGALTYYFNISTKGNSLSLSYNTLKFVSNNSISFFLETHIITDGTPSAYQCQSDDDFAYFRLRGVANQGAFVKVDLQPAGAYGYWYTFGDSNDIFSSEWTFGDIEDGEDWVFVVYCNSNPNITINVTTSSKLFSFDFSYI